MSRTADRRPKFVPHNINGSRMSWHHRASVEDHRAPEGSPTIPYDAFISYARSDRNVASAVEKSLRRFATPWYRTRKLRVFRDESSLAHDPSLWSGIERALMASRWFLLLASPDSATRPWVNREIEWWLDNRGPDHLIIGLAASEITWRVDGPRGHLESPALPASLLHAWEQEPMWVDLRTVAAQKRISKDDSGAYSAIASVASVVAGVPKDELIGEDVRQQRRALAFLRTGIVAVLVLALIASFAAALAIRQRDRANAQQRLATLRAVSAQAEALASRDPDASLLMAAEAYRLDDGAEGRSVLMRAANANPDLAWTSDVGATIVQWAVSPSGTAIATADSSGGIIVWSRDGRRRALPPVNGRPTSMAMSQDGSHMVVVTEDLEVRVYDVEEATSVAEWTGPRSDAVLGVAIDDTGDFVALLADASTLTLHEATSGRRLATRQSLPYPSGELRFRHGTLDFGAYDGTMAVFSLPFLALRRTAGQPRTPAGHYIPAISPDLAYFGIAKDSFSWAEPWAASASPQDAQLEGEVTGGGQTSAEAFAIAQGGKRTAVVSGGLIYIQDTYPTGSAPPRPRAPLSGLEPVQDVRFVGGPGHLAAISRDMLAVYQLGGPGLGATVIKATLVDEGGVIIPAFVDLNSTTGMAVWTDGNGMTLTSDTLGQFASQSIDFGDATRVALGDERDIVAMRPGGELVVVEGGRSPVTLEDSDGHDWINIAILSERKRVTAVDATGVIAQWNLDGNQLKTLTDVVEPYTTFSDFSSDGSRLVLGDCSGLQVLDIASLTGKRLVGWKECPQGVAAIADGALVLASGRVTQFDRSGRRRGAFSAEGSDVQASTDGSTAALMDSQGVVSVYDVSSGLMIARLPTPLPNQSMGGAPGDNMSMAVSDDGMHLLTAISGGSALRWHLDPGELIRDACRAAGRDLTTSEWIEYVGSSAPQDLRCSRPLR